LPWSENKENRKAIFHVATAILAIVIISVATLAGINLFTHEGQLGVSAFPVERVGSGIIGYIVPLYSYPNPSTRYDDLIQLKETYPSVPIGVILNLHNGPGLAPDPLIASYIEKFRAAGIVVLGYVYTGGANRSVPGTRNLMGSDAVNGVGDYGRGTEQSIEAWASFYSVDGIYLDNGPAGNASSPVAGFPGHTVLEYYKTATEYAKDNFGFNLVFGNPGGVAGQNYSGAFVGSVDVINSIESAQLDAPSEVALSTTRNGGNSSQWSMIANNSPNPPSTGYLQSIKDYIGWIYVTNEGPGATYENEPSYQNTTLENLAILDGSYSVETVTLS
jgi:Spherulation-specific family 4